MALETIRGVNTTSKSLEQKRNRKDSEKSTFFGGDQKTENHRKTAYMSRLCKVCNGPHGVWRCEKFKAMSVQERWDAANRLHLCFHCLGGDHFGQTCVTTRICGINNCKDKRNRLLHTHRNQQHGIEQIEERSSQLMSDQNAPSGEASAGNSNQSVESERKPLVVSLPQDSADPQTERSHTTTVAEHADVRVLALRTVPVIVKNGGGKLRGNALLDEASTKTYINADAAAELGLQGRSQKVTVNVLNGQNETFDTMPVKVELESFDGSVKTAINAFTSERVTGNMKEINWGAYAAKWTHLKDIQFPDPGLRPFVDILIGVDYAELHYSFKDVGRRSGEPVARRTPLGWTCVRSPSGLKGSDLQTSFTHTYLDREHRQDSDEICVLLRSFWKVEASGTFKDAKILNFDDKLALEKVENSIKYVDGKYQVAIPWKDDELELPDNYESAVRRLFNTKRGCGTTQRLEKLTPNASVSTLKKDTFER